MTKSFCPGTRKTKPNPHLTDLTGILIRVPGQKLFGMLVLWIAAFWAVENILNRFN